MNHRQRRALSNACPSGLFDGLTARRLIVAIDPGQNGAAVLVDSAGVLLASIPWKSGGCGSNADGLVAVRHGAKWAGRLADGIGQAAAGQRIAVDLLCYSSFGGHFGAMRGLYLWSGAFLSTIAAALERANIPTTIETASDSTVRKALAIPCSKEKAHAAFIKKYHAWATGSELKPDGADVHEDEHDAEILAAYALRRTA